MNRKIVFFGLSLVLFGCPTTPVCGNGKKEGKEQCDDGNQKAGDGCDPGCVVGNINNPYDSGTDAGADASVDAGTTDAGDPGTDAGPSDPDAGPTDGGSSFIVCADLAAPSSGTCEVTPGDGNKLFAGVVLAPGQVLQGGQVLVDTNGNIACVACDCSGVAGAATATKITCAQGVISPGLINSHDHISYQAPPYVASVVPNGDPAERYEHRHDWRVGHDGHLKISSGGNATNAQVRWAELRQVMSGTTSIVGATFTAAGNGGLLRNLDSVAGQEGLAEGARGIVSETFPLGDTAGTELVNSCAYPQIDSPSVIPFDSAYLPHVSEGIEASALNEFRCLSGQAGGGQDILSARTGIVHGIALKASDIGLMAATQTGLVWSPRSNVSLYGDTAAIPVYSRLGVRIALGTDWVISGSMNLLRELHCADHLNQSYFGSVLTDEQLWLSVTGTSADVTQTSEKIGRLAVGKVADLAIFKQKNGKQHRSVVEANPDDVVLTVRGGKVLYGDWPVVAAFDVTSQCEPLDVCGTQKGVCVQSELATTFSSLQSANAATYPLFFCGAPLNEPSCEPQRDTRNVKNMSSSYLGPVTGDSDGDGVVDSLDNCPSVFNPIRPMDDGHQADVDGDAVGDSCDVCPLDANTTACTGVNANDSDRDGIDNGIDNCPFDANPSQMDSDNDGKGDLCDSCAAANPGSQACPASIYDVRAPASPYLGQRVMIGNALVTAVGSNGFYVQVHEIESTYLGPDNSGLFVFKPAAGVLPGDRLDVTGVPSVYFGETELAQVTLPTADGGVLVTSAGNPAPTPIVVTTAGLGANDGGLATRLEGALVTVQNVVVTNASPTPGTADTAPTYEYEIDGALRVDDLFYRPAIAPTLGQQLMSITGVLVYRNNFFKIEPRSSSDVVLGAPQLASLGPDLVFIREGTTGPTLPTPLTVSLSNTPVTDTTVTLSSAGAELVVDPSVVIAAGALSAPILVTGVAQSDAGVAVTATLGAISKTAYVRVIGATETPHLVGLTPATVDVLAGGTTTFTVALDLPALPGTMISLTIFPNTFGVIPPVATVNDDQLSATFTLTADVLATGSGTITASLGADTFNATVNISQVSTNHVVISEIAVKGPGGANDEFIELYNPTTGAIDIGGWKVQYKSKTGATYSDKTSIPVNTFIQPRSYFLISGPSLGGGVTADLKTTLDLQLAGDSGHVRLGPSTISSAKVDASAIDTLGYGSLADAPEGGVKTADIATSATTTNSFERKASVASDPTSMGTGGIDAAKGNGYDSDNNGADFVVRPARDPQSSASPAEP